MRSLMVRLHTIAVLSLLLGCTQMPPRPDAVADSVSPADALDAPTDSDALAPDVAPDGDAPVGDAPGDVAPDGPDAPAPTGPRLTGAFVSSGSSSGRLSGGFVWHGGSSRLSGWLQ